MKYQNIQPSEGINSSKKNPLPDFLVLLVGSLITIAIVSVFLAYSMGWLAKKIPFEKEVLLTESFEHYFDEVDNAELSTYLNKLVDQLMVCSELPTEMEIKLHYIATDQFNAFATLGGHVFIYKGLLRRLKNENQLAMVLAHEIGHIKHRDPLIGLGRGAVISLAFSMVLGNSPNLLGDAGLLTLLSFSRSMESHSDQNGVEALMRCYGHANGSYQTFELFKTARTELGATKPILAMFETHPLDDDRIEDIKYFAEISNISVAGELTPLPEGFNGWLK